MTSLCEGGSSNCRQMVNNDSTQEGATVNDTIGTLENLSSDNLVIQS